MLSNRYFGRPHNSSPRAWTLLAFCLAACFAAFAARTAEAQVRTWQVTSGLWQTAANWSGGVAPTSTAQAVFQGGSAETSELNADAGISRLTFSNAGTKLIESDSATARVLTMGTDATAILINAGAGAVTLGSVAGPLDMRIPATQSWTNNTAPANVFTVLGGITSSAASGTQTLTVTGTGATLFSGNLANGSSGGTLALVKSGNGTLTLSGSNTHTGLTTLSAGMLALPRPAALAGGNTADWTRSFVNVNGGTLALSYGGAEEFTDADVQILANRDLFRGGSSAMLALDTTNATGPVTFTGTFANGSAGTNISFAKLGPGTLILTGTIGTTSSTRTIASGTLQLGTSATAGSLGAANVINNGALVFEALQGSAPGVISGTGQVIKKGNTQLGFTVDMTYTGPTTIESGTLRLSDGAATNGWLAGDVSISNSGVLIIRRNATKEFVGNISGAGSVTTEAISGGNIVFTGSSSYTGGTTIQGGRLTIGNGGTAGSIVGNVANAGTLGFNRSDALAYTGTISGAGQLVKLGAGSLTLSAAQTYSGTTTVSGGRLVVADTGSFTASSRIVVDGSGAELRYNSAAPLARPLTLIQGILSGTGTIGTAVSIGVNVVLSPGNSPGTQAFTSLLEWAPGGSYQWELNALTGSPGTNWDLVNVTSGTFDLSSLATTSGNQFWLDVVTLDALDATGSLASPYDGGSYTLPIASYNQANFLLPAGFSNAAGADLTSLFAFNDFTNWQGTKPQIGDIFVKINSSADGIDLVIVPEPAALALAGIGIAAAGYALRLLRRREAPIASK